jgi:hypothetical protein
MSLTASTRTAARSCAAAVHVEPSLEEKAARAVPVPSAGETRPAVAKRSRATLPLKTMEKFNPAVELTAKGGESGISIRDAPTPAGIVAVINLEPRTVLLGLDDPKSVACRRTVKVVEPPAEKRSESVSWWIE